MIKPCLPIAGVTLLMLSARLPAQQPAPKTPPERAEAPAATNPKRIEKSMFTFVRIRYGTGARTFSPVGKSRRWATDYPDADLGLTARVQQKTALKVDPAGRVLELTDPELFGFPFIYMAEPGALALTDAEVPILRRYLLSGGFLMLDDFWGEEEWKNMAGQIKRVFPERDFVDLPRTHAIFHQVFDIPNDLNLQVPNVVLGTGSQYHGITWERDDAKEVHIRGLFDNSGRLMVLAAHNTDNGDGWERVAENEFYRREFSEKKAYPLGINIVSFVMKR